MILYLYFPNSPFIIFLSFFFLFPSFRHALLPKIMTFMWVFPFFSKTTQIFIFIDYVVFVFLSYFPSLVWRKWHVQIFSCFLFFFLCQTSLFENLLHTIFWLFLRFRITQIFLREIFNMVQGHLNILAHILITHQQSSVQIPPPL